MENLLSSVKFIALATAIIATFAYPKYAGGKAKYFLFSIWLIVITEFSYKFVFHDVVDEKYPTYFIANTYTVVQFLFYLFWYRALMKNTKFRQLLLFFALFFILFSVVNTLFIQDFIDTTQTYIFIVGVILTIISICIYFVEVFNDDIVLHFQRSVYFWFSLGVLLFLIPFLPFMIAVEFFDYGGNLYSMVLFILNILMHGCFVIGVLWSKKKYNY